MEYSSTVLVLEYNSSTIFWVLVLGTPSTRLVLVLEGQCTRYSVKKEPSTRVHYLVFAKSNKQNEFLIVNCSQQNPLIYWVAFAWIRADRSWTNSFLIVRTSEIKRWNMVKWLGVIQRIVLFENKRLSAAENVWKLPQILTYLAIKVTYHRNRATPENALASRTFSRTHFQVLGLKSSSPRKLPCPRLEDSTIFWMVKIL